MGIDAFVSPMSVAWRGIRPAAATVYFSVDHLAELGEPFDYEAWSKRLRALPSFDEPFAFTDLLPGRGPLSASRVRKETLAFQRRVSERVGVDVTWDDSGRVDDEPPARLDPTAMARIRLLGARLLSQETPATEWLSSLATDDPWSHPDYEASGARLRSLAPQLSLLDIANLYLPADFHEVLHGLPYCVGSASRLRREVEQLDASIARLTSGFQRSRYMLEVLAELSERAVALDLPLWVDG
ncbi:MAG: hypothetical protein R3B82_16070 [Sandaracinaceae bacterium]